VVIDGYSKVKDIVVNTAGNAVGVTVGEVCSRAQQGGLPTQDGQTRDPHHSGRTWTSGQVQEAWSR